MAVTSPRDDKRALPSVPISWGEREIARPQVRIPALQDDVDHIIDDANVAFRTQREWSGMLAVAIQNILDGKILATGSVTLTDSSATTTLTDLRIGPNSVILFMPTTANAATGWTALYVSARGKQTATLTHANNAETDRTYAYAVLG